MSTMQWRPEINAMTTSKSYRIMVVIRSLLCIGAVFVLSGTRHGHPFQAAPLNNGYIVIDSLATGSPATPEESFSFMPEQPKENFIYDLVIPDLCFSEPALADCRNFRLMIRRPVPDAERQTVPGVNLVSPADAD